MVDLMMRSKLLLPTTASVLYRSFLPPQIIPLSQVLIQRWKGVDRIRIERRRLMATNQETQNLPGVCAKPDAATSKFFLQHTMLRVKDPERSLDFYTRVMGMKLVAKYDMPDLKFSLFFLGYDALEDIPENINERTIWLFRKNPYVELVHNWGTESDDTKYHDGNTDPLGFGHIAVSVPDVYAACERFQELGVPFAKGPDDGFMKGLAFIKDPDGYWVEILSPEGLDKIFNP